MTGPWDLELRLEPGADDGVKRVIVDVEMVALLDPLAQRGIGGKAGGERILYHAIARYGH